MINKELIIKAYKLGKSRNVSLSLGYYISPNKCTFFCQNPNSSCGVLVGEETGYYDNIPENYTRVDMYKLVLDNEV